MLSKQKKDIFTWFAILFIIVFFVYCTCVFKRQYKTLVVVATVENKVENKIKCETERRPIINTPNFYTLQGPVEPVRGTGDSKYRQIGTLSSYTNSNQQFPLIAKKNANDSTLWYYYTKVNNVAVPIMVNNKICDDTYGCEALFSNDSVFIPDLDGDYRVALFSTGYY